MSDEFLGSIAHEDVNFVTQIAQVTTPGDNFMKLMVYIEGIPTVAPADPGIASGRYIEDPSAFIPLKTGSPYYVATVTKDTYGVITKGLLKSWLQDYYLSGNVYDAYLVVFAPDLPDSLDAGYAAAEAAAIDALEAVYAETKAYAYFKTVLAGEVEEGICEGVVPDIAVSLALLCAGDKTLLSAPPLYPFLTETPQTLASDLIYDALETVDPAFGTTDAFMTAYADVARNGSLFSVGLMLSMLNASGTPVGNSLDYWGTPNIASSGVDGVNLSKTIRDLLKENNIAFFKPVGDGTTRAAVGVQSLSGAYMQAVWLVNYINCMCKILVAQYITQPNILRNAQTYAGIINILDGQLRRFGSDGTGRLQNVTVTAPAFSKLPAAAGDAIVVPNAWSAEYVDQVHTVHIQGSLVIAA